MTADSNSSDGDDVTALRNDYYIQKKVYVPTSTCILYYTQHRNTKIDPYFFIRNWSTR